MPSDPACAAQIVASPDSLLFVFLVKLGTLMGPASVQVHAQLDLLLYLGLLASPLHGPYAYALSRLPETGRASLRVQGNTRPDAGVQVLTTALCGASAGITLSQVSPAGPTPPAATESEA